MTIIMNCHQKQCYVTPELMIISLEFQGMIASSSLENPGRGDEWNWN